MEIAYIEDDAGLRELAVAHTISRYGDVLEFGSGAEALKVLPFRKPSLMLLDLKLPDVHGLELLSHLQVAGVAAPVIVLTGSPDPVDIVRSMLAGAQGYVAKHTLDRDLPLAIPEVLAGGNFLTKDHFRLYVEYTRGLKLNPVVSFQEMRVLLLRHFGRSNKEVAEALSLSESAVKKIIRLMFARLGVSSISSAAATVWPWAIDPHKLEP